MYNVNLWETTGTDSCHYLYCINKKSVNIKMCNMKYFLYLCGVHGTPAVTIYIINLKNNVIFLPYIMKFIKLSVDSLSTD